MLTRGPHVDDHMSIAPRCLEMSLPIRPTSRSLTPASILSMVAVAALLVLPGQAMARTHKTACTASSKARSGRSPHACSQSTHASKSLQKGKTQARSKLKGHHGKPATAKAGHAGKATHPGDARHPDQKKPAPKDRAKTPPPTSTTPATCEDGSAPVHEEDGSFGCEDESEPGCENGSAPVLSSDGSTLLCSVSSGGPGAPPGASCEDGSTPIHEEDGSFGCEDESEPSCEAGSGPTLSKDHSSLLCTIVSG
jgi:hypothetical protein